MNRLNTTHPIKPEDILAEHTENVRALANHIRAIVKAAIPETEERAYPGWHAIGFRHPQAGYFCGVFPFEHEISIVFEHGRSLRDPEGVLQGSTKQTRSIPLASEGELEQIRAAFEALLLESIALGASLKAGRAGG